MTGTPVSDHSSKEFAFCDPEKKFKNLTANPKSSLKIKQKDKSETGTEETNPPPFSDQSLNVKLDAPEIIKKNSEFYDSSDNAIYDSNNYSGAKNWRALELVTVSPNEMDPGVEIHDIGLALKSRPDPRMSCSNGEIFEKSEMENSIFSPNNAPGNRGQGKMVKNNQTKLDVTMEVTIPNNLDVAKKKPTPNLANRRSKAWQCRKPANCRTHT